MLDTALEVEITALLIQVSMMADGSLKLQIVSGSTHTNSWLACFSVPEHSITVQLRANLLLCSRIYSTFQQGRPRQQT